jgi:hypothetical protein
MPRVMTLPPSAPELSAARRRDKLHGLAVVALAFLLSLGISLCAKRISEPEQVRPPGPPTSDGVIGYPAAVDATATLAAARGLTRRTQLRGFVAEGVRADGTLDVRDEKGSVRYAFQSAAGQGPQPPRVPGVVPRRNLCGRQNVWVRAKGIVVEQDQVGLPCPHDPIEPLPEPRCTLKEIFDHAIGKGAAPDRLARIEYYRATAGPAWRFQLSDGSLRFSLYGDCRRELNQRESFGLLP